MEKRNKEIKKIIDLFDEEFDNCTILSVNLENEENSYSVDFYDNDKGFVATAFFMLTVEDK